MTTIRQVVTYFRESRRFESMYTMQGKPDQHATHISHSVRIWHPTICISHGLCIATFHADPTELDIVTTLEKKGY
jgi:hypothetical protein